MKTPGLLSEIKSNPVVLAMVIAFHLVLVVLLSISLFTDNKPAAPVAKKHTIIDAVVVDSKLYDEREKQKKLAAQKKRDEEKRRKAEQLKLKKQKELERKRLEQKKREQKKLAEAKRKKELERKKAAERKKQLALKKEKERKKKAEELRRKKEAERLAAEKKRLEAERRKKLEAERLAAEKKHREEEERKRRAEEKAEFERALIEEERRREEAKRAAERLARLQTQREQYIMLITQQVENSWLRPAGDILGESCDVLVTQTMTGEVLDVKLQSCTSSKSFQESVVRAVYRASPLPQAPNPDVFERQIYFTFKPRM